MKLLRYDEWLKQQVKYTDCECAVYGCNKPGLYESGDARCWFPSCEEHASMKQQYLIYLGISITENIDVDVAYQRYINKHKKLEKRLTEVLNGI